MTRKTRCDRWGYAWHNFGIVIFKFSNYASIPISGPWEIWMEFRFQANFNVWWLIQLLWNCPQVNVTECYWWWIKVASGNDCGSMPFTVYPKKYAHGFVVLCFVVVMQSFIMNSHEVFIHIHQGYFTGTGAIVRLPQCQWSKPDGYEKISQFITTTKHSKAKTVCIFLGIYCTSANVDPHDCCNVALLGHSDLMKWWWQLLYTIVLHLGSI